MVGRYSNALKSRFWSQVKKTRTCWRWQGGKTVRLDSKKYRPQKVAYILLEGSSARNTHVMNGCGNDECVNPKHHYLREKKSRLRHCYSCKLPIQKGFAAIKKSQSGRVYCSKSCATRENNKGKPRFKSKGWGDLTRASIKQKWIREGRDLVCQRCDFDGNLKPWCMEIDHIVPVSRGGLTILENLQPLCLNCHRDKTVRETKQRHTGA